MLSSPVMTFKRSVWSFVTVSFSSWQIATRLSFWSWVNTLHKLRCHPMHVQVFCENSLTRSITNSNLCTEIVYGTTTILVESRPYLFHFWGDCCRAWPTWSIIISSRSAAILETSFGYGSCTNHQKPVWTFQKFHFPFYPISHRTWCTPFVCQLLPYRRYKKIADSWCNTYIKTRATIKRFHIQPRHSAHSLTRHHRNTP